MNNKYIKLGALAITLLYVDLFCGAGGTSTGIETAKIDGKKCAKVVVCINHDPTAIKSHAENHPETIHYTEDIKTVKIQSIIDQVNKMRKQYPLAKVILWASLECTNHSRAKGGMSRDADSRTLAEHLFRYFSINPDSIQIENVEEFLIWGPLIEKVVDNSYCPLNVAGGELKPVWVPDPARKGEYYKKWVKDVQKYGYNYEYKILNSADFGAYTSRKRLFIQFNNENMPIVWPKATHSKSPVNGLFESLEKWKSVKDVLNLKDKGNSIFDRIKSEKTFKRILDGIKKEGKDYFLTSYYGNGSSHSIYNPIGTLTTKDRYALHFIQYNYSTLTTSSILNPAGTITTIPKHNLVTVQWLTDMQYGRVSIPIEGSCPTIIARQDKKPLYLLQAERGYPNNFIRDTDSNVVKELKEFMIRNFIRDIFIRMLTVQELKEIMGFPKDYILVGTQADQKKFIGNAVEVTMARKICEATAARLFELRKVA